MTLKELARKLDDSIDAVRAHYKHIYIDIPDNENYELSEELVRKSIPNYNKKLNKNIERRNSEDKKINKNEELNIKIVNRLESNLETYFSFSKIKLIEEIIIHNQIDELLLNGCYSPDAKGGKYGFFEDIKHVNGYYLEYPVLNTIIDNIFIYTEKLEKNKYYTFEVQIAKEQERKKHRNPFFLEAKSKNINEIVKLSVLDEEINAKEDKISELENYINNVENAYNKEIEEIEKLYVEYEDARFAEIKQGIENRTITIKSQNQEIENKKKELIVLKNDININNTKLNRLINQKTEMETTIEFLKEKIKVCKNLEFLSKEDANKYLFQLNSNKFEIGNEYLDFENDLSGSFPDLVQHLLNYLYHEKNLIYTEYQIKNFITLLLTNDLIVLSGLSGSGKTQIVKAVADAIGGVAKIIPVKPNWTSSDDLLGYYNPIQSSFLPTPFTEAIVEAIQNPQQMYLICLDEMNLARVEYYFADFLSKLEEREKQPEIDLYAKHEEELFVSEFKTLLTLIESSIGNNNISSWKDFLENDLSRNRFFELIGNSEEDTMLQIHSKMKRRLIDILKFPSTLKIPNNVRFIGAINVDETTHYFSPKILDRVHIVKFENPLLFDEFVSEKMNKIETVLKPVYVHPGFFGKRTELPAISDNNYAFLVDSLKEINKKYLLPLSIDFGIRSIRQSINYAKKFNTVSQFHSEEFDDFSMNLHISFNTIVLQKIFPRFLLEDAELSTGETKIQLLTKLKEYIRKKIDANQELLDVFITGFLSYEYLEEMIKIAEQNNGQINFWSSNIMSIFQDTQDNEITF